MEYYLVRLARGTEIEVAVDCEIEHYLSMQDILDCYPTAVAIQPRGCHYWLSREHVLNAE